MVNRIFFSVFGLLGVCLFALGGCRMSDQNKYQKLSGESGGYSYSYVSGDPLGVRVYRLANGLTVYLSNYQASPRIYTSIAVRAGGKNDPADATGLAHYLEHMLFKGTSDFGTMDWAKEKPLLDSIQGLYDRYRVTKDTEARKALYKQIDEVSYAASNYAIAGEYDKMMAALGVTGTNAYTSEDATVYINDIPSNQLANWLEIEGNRFQTLVPRLFHTELETVYEEKNRGLDSDDWALYERVMKHLFPDHPYGTQTVIGTIEHLKNPSVSKIISFFETYYRPNNVAICLSGELDYDETIALIDKHFGSWESNADLPVWESPAYTPLTSAVIDTVVGPSAEAVGLAFRIPGRRHPDYWKAKLVDMILSNNQAGLIDLNLRQNQRVLEAYSYVSEYQDYSMQVLYGKPRRGQSLEEVKDLLLAQLDSLREGQFESWLLGAIVNDFEKSSISQYENNRTRVRPMVEAFTNDLSWDVYVAELASLRSLTKADIIQFAQSLYKDNYVLLYKKTGVRDSEKVDKPPITQVQLNSDQVSDFQQAMLARDVPDMVPVFADYEGQIQQAQVGALRLHYLPNDENDLFTLYYYSALGRGHDPKFALAMRYLNYLAPEGMSVDAFKKEFYKIGCEWSAVAQKDYSYIKLHGLSAQLPRALTLLEALLANPTPDAEALQKLREGILQERANQRKEQYYLRSGLINYALYGAQSPFTHVVKEDELARLQPTDLTRKVSEWLAHEHQLLYYGPRPIADLQKEVNDKLKRTADLRPIPKISKFVIQDVQQPTIYWTHYDMVQSEMVFVSPQGVYSADLAPEIALFNEYFSGSMSSPMFQELREARALAYATFARYAEADRAGDKNYFFAYIGTQADKQTEASAALQGLLRTFPVNEKHFHIAKESVLNKIETQRILRTNLLFDYLRAQRRGINHDLRQDIYDKVQTMTLENLVSFHLQMLKKTKYHLAVLGHKDKINLKALQRYGNVQEVSLDALSGYRLSKNTPTAPNQK